MSDHKEQGHGGGGHGGGNSSRWLLTYADMITLMMVFFVVLYAMSEVDKNKYASLAGGLRAAFGGGNMIVNTGMGVGDGVNVPPLDPKLQANLPVVASPEALANQIGEKLYADFQHDGRFVVRITDRGLTISLVGSAAFDSGKADIKSEFRPLLDEIAAKLGPIGNDISIEGFADTDPIHTPEFPSNWYLAAARANRVRDYLESKGVGGGRLIVVSYGDARPIAENTTAEGKAKNRRVDIVILKDKVKVDLGQEINTGKK